MEELLEVRADASLVREEPAAGAPNGNDVTIAGFSFRPQTISVPVGETVTWRNDDAADHTVTHGGGAFGSDTLAQGAEFRFRFDRPGTFDYVCALHPGMRGTVHVH